MKIVNYALIGHQADFINSKKKYVLNSGGVGSGKTYSICLKAQDLCQTYPGIFGLIGAQTYPLLRDTTLREFLNIVPQESIKSYNKTEQHFRFTNGSEVIFRSFDDETKLKSLNLGFAAIEEMTDTTEEIFKMLRTRLRQKGMPGVLFGATNPGTFGNYVYKYFIEEPINNSEVIYSISADNDYLPEEYLEDLRSLKKTNPEYYERMVMGKWGALEGLIYMFPMDQRIYELPDKRKIHRWIAGLDFGHDHPTAMAVYGIRENIYYQYEEFYQRKLSASDIIRNVKRILENYDIDIIYCDSSRPEIIEDLQRAEIPAEPAIKDVFDGIMHVKGMMGDKKLFVNKECHYTLREYDSYIWDAKNTVKEVPIKANDDCYDKETEILTNNGWKLFKDLNNSDLVYTKDNNLNSIYEKPLKIINKKYNGELLSYFSKKIEFVITPTQFLLISNQYNTKIKQEPLLEFIQPNNLKELNYIQRNDKTWNRNTVLNNIEIKQHKNGVFKINIIDYAKFLGLWLAEGSVDNHNYGIIIDNNEKEAEEIIKNLGLKYFKYKQQNGNIYRYVILCKELYLKVCNLGNFLTKRIPQEFRNSNKKILKALFDGYYLGDGYKTAKNLGMVSISYQLLSDFQEICFKLGYVTNLYKIKNECIAEIKGKKVYCKKAYRLSISKAKKGISGLGFAELYKNKIKKINYNDIIYDVRTNSGYILIRRNGKIMWSSNCMDASRYALYSDSRNLGLDKIETYGQRETIEQW